MGLLFSLALLMGVIAAAARAHAAEGKAPPVGDSVKKIVATGNPRKVAAAAIVAQKSGDKKLAAALAVKARSMQKASAPAAFYQSPFTNVPHDAWNAWVQALRGPNPRAVSPLNHLGLFAMGMRRLVDLGLATNPRQELATGGGGRKVWVADWIPALQPGPDKFLSDADLQYRVFVKSVNDDFKAIKEKMPTAVGVDVDGAKATPSGLLAVTKQAGVEGLKKWLADPKARQQYATTTAQFKKLNGVF